MTFVDWLRSVLTNAAWWFTVRPWEQAVRLTFGKKRVLLGPGIYFKVPIVHQALVFPIRTRTVYVPMQTLRSKDGRTVVIGLILKYEIADLFLVLDSLHNPGATLAHLAQGIVGKLVPTLDGSEVVASTISKAINGEINPGQYGVSAFDIMVSDNADLSQRTFRLIQEQRWFSPDSEIDKMARQ